MTFLVSYRAKDGSLREESVEAASRSDCIAKCRARGIVPAGIKNGPGKSAARKGTGGATARNAACAAAVLLVLAAGFAVWQWLSKDDTVCQPMKNQEKVLQTSVIKTETPPPPPAAAPVPEAKPKKLRKWEYPVERTNELNAAEMRKWVAMHRPPPGYTNDTSRTEPPPKYAIFKHNSENEIAALLTMTPGEPLVGEPSYSKKFTEDFLKSLETPIIVSEDDSPEDAELKRMMVQTKIELKQRLDEGDDLGRILLDTRKEYRDLARYKMTLQSELSALRNDPDITAQDMDDFINAANQLLEAKGIAPIKLGPVARRRLMMKKR